jgi:outer membrane protein insertion porin family
MKKPIFFHCLLSVWMFLYGIPTYTQHSVLDYAQSKPYIIRHIEVESPSENILQSYVIQASQLHPGQKIRLPGVEVSMAIKNLQRTQLFTQIKIFQKPVNQDSVDLAIYLEEVKHISRKHITGLTQTESNRINHLVSPEMKQGLGITEYLLKNTTYKIQQYFAKKNYPQVQVNVIVTPDTAEKNAPDILPGGYLITLNIHRGEKTKLARIEVEGNQYMNLSSIRKSLRESMIETSRFDVWTDIANLLTGQIKAQQIDSTLLEKGFYESAVEYLRNSIRLNLFTSTKFDKNTFNESKASLLDLYASKGYKDAKIIHDSIYQINQTYQVKFNVQEGPQYYFRNITWIGNKTYRSGTLDTVLGIRKGDVYDQLKLQAGLINHTDGSDITSLYQDQGFFYFTAVPVETVVPGDSVDIEIRIYEGRQPRIGKINIYGNTKTSDVVILRELQVHPGDLFNKSSILLSQEFLSQLGIFIAKDMEVVPKPNALDGTVDLDFIVKEAPADQVFLSGGWGANQLVGSLTFQFNNLSLRNFFKPKAWSPLPSGDGQKLSIIAQANDKYYRNISLSFTEPWLGGKKPISFSLAFNHSLMDNTMNQSFKLITTHASISLGTRLKWPDIFFQTSLTLSYQQFQATNYALFPNSQELFTGTSNNLALRAQIQRNSTNDPIFPTRGSIFSASVEATLPYSYFSANTLAPVTLQDKYTWLEYHQWKLKFQWFIALDQPANPKKSSRLVGMFKGEMGFLGYYNSNIGVSPFKRYFLGGDGLSGYYMDGREIIGCRGYQNFALTPGFTGEPASATGGGVYTKYTLELRFLMVSHPQVKLYALAFGEAGNAWQDTRNFSPFELKRSAGIGIRLYLPMFGLVGLDYGYGFDRLPGINESTRPKGIFHLTIGQQF